MLVVYDRRDVSETDTDKTDGSCEFVICHYWDCLRINFRFQPKLCDGYHDMTQKSNDFANVTVRGYDYKINFWFITESEAAGKKWTTILMKK